MSEAILQRLAALADRYHAEGEIGHGGMATVFRARDLKHDRLVAIKVLRPDLAQAIGGERFLREIVDGLAHAHRHGVLDQYLGPVKP